jgi:hypothetical protein
LTLILFAGMLEKTNIVMLSVAKHLYHSRKEQEHGSE